MRKTTSAAILFSCCCICSVTQTCPAAGLFDFERGKSALSQEKLIENLFTPETLKGRSLPHINASGIEGIPNSPDVAKLFAKNLTSGVSQRLLQMRGKKADDATSHDLMRLVEFRDLLLASGGYGNSCMAGSISMGMDAFVLDRLIGGDRIDPSTMSLCLSNSINLALVATCLDRGNELVRRDPKFNIGVISSSSRKPEIFESILGKYGLKRKLGETIEIRDWQRLDPAIAFAFGFGRETFSASSSVAHLMSWAFVVDEQFAISVLIELNKQEPTALRDVLTQNKSQMPRIAQLMEELADTEDEAKRQSLQAEYDEKRAVLSAANRKISERIQGILQKHGAVFRCYDFRRWDGELVYEYAREYSAVNGDPFEQRLKISLGGY